MKKFKIYQEDKFYLVLLFIMFVIGMIGIPTMCHAQNFIVEGNNFKQQKSEKARQKSEPKKTDITWTDTKGNTYPVYMSSTGSCFIIKTSKNTGKEYRNYLGPEASMAICRKLGVEYKGKKPTEKD